MAQTFITPLEIARRSLIALENNLVMGNLVYRGYSPEFQAGRGATVIVRSPTTFTATAFTTNAVAQAATEGSVSVILDSLYDVSFEVTAKELTTEVSDFTEQLIEPAARELAQKVDYALTGLYSDVAGFGTVLGTTAAPADLAGIRKVMNILKAPMSDRSCVLYPSTEALYIVKDAFLHAEKRGDKKALREGSMGRVMGMDFYMDQNIRDDVTGGGGGTLGVLFRGTAGSTGTAATLDTMDSAATCVAGDVFAVTGRPGEWYVMKTVDQAGGTAATISFTPGLGGDIADNSTANLLPDHIANLAFHKNAFALVTAPLAMPIGGARGAVVSHNGLSLRVVYDYTASTKKNWCSVDILFGVKTLNKDLAARLCDTNV